MVTKDLNCVMEQGFFFFSSNFHEEKNVCVGTAYMLSVSLRSPSGKTVTLVNHTNLCSSVPSGNPYGPALKGHRDACTGGAATRVSSLFIFAYGPAAPCAYRNWKVRGQPK